MKLRFRGEGFRDWKHDEVREVDDTVARALLRERGDLEIVADADAADIGETPPLPAATVPTKPPRSSVGKGENK